MYRQAVFYFIAVLLIAVAGFYPSYFGSLKDNDVVHHFHGITATAWMLLLITQAWLFRAGRLNHHRVFGRISFVLVPLFLLSGILMIRAMLSSPSGFSQAFGSRLAWADLVTISTFSLFYFLAIQHRKNIQLHARYLAATAILVLPPALGRLLPALSSAITSFEMSFHLTYAICIMLVVGLIFDDYRKGKLRAPYWILLGSVVVQQLGFYYSNDWAWWQQIIHNIRAAV